MSVIDNSATTSSNQSLYAILERWIPKGEDKEFVNYLIYGTPKNREIIFEKDVWLKAKAGGFELKGFTLLRPDGDLTSPTRIGLFQHAMPLPTTFPVDVQKRGVLELGQRAVEVAGDCGVKILCFQEVWNMPMAFCTSKKMPWVEFAEDAIEGETTSLLKGLAKQYSMVIVSPIFERDRNDFLWNSAVVIDADGKVLGVSRKNHIPISGKFAESYYYNPSEIGHPVFQTRYGRIAICICYSRHHPQCFMAYALNNAQIVFNPSATVASFSESLWPIEARDAARRFGFYTCSINRVGTEEFPAWGQAGQGIGAVAGPFFGSSYISSPDGRRTPGLSNDRNGLLVTDIDLSLCSNDTLEKYRVSLGGIANRMANYGKE